MSNYEEFKKAIEESTGVEENLEHVASGEPKRIGAGRQNLEVLINNHLKSQRINMNTPDSQVYNFANTVEKRLEGEAANILKDNPSDIISQIRSDNDEKFEKAYLAVPFVEGAESNTEIAEAHKTYITLQSEAQKAIQTKDFGSLLVRVLENTKTKINRPYANDKDTEELLKLYVASLEASGPEAIMGEAQYLINEAKERMDALVPEDKRAAYAEKNLKALAEKGEDEARMAVRVISRITG